MMVKYQRTPASYTSHLTCHSITFPCWLGTYRNFHPVFIRDQQQNYVFNLNSFSTIRITGRIYEAPGSVAIDLLQTNRSDGAKISIQRHYSIGQQNTQALTKSISSNTLQSGAP